jgi:hypothetical protein
MLLHEPLNCAAGERKASASSTLGLLLNGNDMTIHLRIQRNKAAGDGQ